MGWTVRALKSGMVYGKPLNTCTCIYPLLTPSLYKTHTQRQARVEQELEKLREVKAKGQQVKAAVNKLYRSLEVGPSHGYNICI